MTWNKSIITIWLMVFLFIFAIIAYAAPALTLNATAVQGGSPAEQSFHVQNDGFGKLRYIITSDSEWLRVFTSIGGTTAENENNLVIVGFDTSKLPVGTHSGTITVSDPLAINSPQTVDVNVTITPPPIIGITQ